MSEAEISVLTISSQLVLCTINVWGKQLGKYDDELNVKICPKTLMRRRNLLKLRL